MQRKKSRPTPKKHWASVTSVLAKKTGLSFVQAKELYDVIKKSKPELSVNQAKRIPSRKLAAYKGVLTRQKKAQLAELKKRVEEKEKRKKKFKQTLFSPRPRSDKPRWETFKYIKPAPKMEKPPKPEPIPLEYSRRPKNRFEKMCQELGAPFLRSGTIAKTIAAQWRNEEWQKKLAQTIADAWASIQRNGYVTEKIREQLNRLLDKIRWAIVELGADPADFWYGILKQLYA